MNCVAQSFHDRLAAKRFDVEIARLRREDKECNDRFVGSAHLEITRIKVKISLHLKHLVYLQHVVKSSKGLDKNIGSFVSKLVTTSDEEI